MVDSKTEIQKTQAIIAIQNWYRKTQVQSKFKEA